MAKVAFGSKAETLERLRPLLKGAIVPACSRYQVSEWKENPNLILEELTNNWAGKTVIVRSSANSEDSLTQSGAGAYLSVANVDGGNTKALRQAIEDVIASYGTAHKDDQFFVQQQISDVAMGGVLFTRVGDNLAPYYVINYDDSSGATDTVTSGSTSELKTYVRFRNSPVECDHAMFRNLLNVVQKLEALFESDALDIEFAVSRSGEIYIFQVRPLVEKSSRTKLSDKEFEEYLYKIYLKVKKLNAPHPGLHGSKAVYSVMTDWNPAEMIGTRPHALALSLYKELITDCIWAYQRDNYGYRNLRSFPLLVSFIGCPYIDVRASLNSFVPEQIDDGLSAKLVDYYIDRLQEAPTDHDKVEFKIIYSCYYLDLAERLKSLLPYGFSELELDRIKFALLNLTNNIISPETGLYKKDLRKIEILESRFHEITESELPPLDQIYWLVEDCKRYGTLPFAGLARAGFIAVQFLESLVSVGVFSEEEKNRFMNSLNTVGKQLGSDLRRYRVGDMSRDQFLERYGHLRPGTYDILSPRYDEAFDLYFGGSSGDPIVHEDAPLELSDQQTRQIAELLISNGLKVSPAQLMVFITEAIEGREYGKFLFTRHLSKILQLLEKFGQRCGIGKEEMTGVHIQTLLRMYSELDHFDVGETLSRDIRVNREVHEVSQSIVLPQLIRNESEVYDFFLGDAEPNYVTRKRVTKFIVIEEDFPHEDLEDKVVFIRSADPGYDWLFSRKIAGLVTLYGGANSHMAIRCAELQIPAVIGCGERNFESWSRSQVLDVDCGNKQVKIIR